MLSIFLGSCYFIPAAHNLFLYIWKKRGVLHRHNKKSGIIRLIVSGDFFRFFLWGKAYAAYKLFIFFSPFPLFLSLSLSNTLSWSVLQYFSFAPFLHNCQTLFSFIIILLYARRPICLWKYYLHTKKKVKIRRQLRGTYVHLFFEAFKCSVSRDFFLPDFFKEDNLFWFKG